MSCRNYIKNHAESGDIVLFRGDSPMSCCISTGTGYYSHAAIILHQQRNLTSPTNEPYSLLRRHDTVVLESNPNDGSVKGYAWGGRDGPQMSIATKRLSEYNGDVYVRQLRVSTVELATNINEASLSFLSECKRNNVKYCSHLGYWMRTFARSNTQSCDARDYYCINFVARCMERAGIVTVAENYDYADNVNFGDFALAEVPTVPQLRYADVIIRLTS